LANDGRIVEFVKDQFRHCKPMLVLGGGSSLLDKAGIPASLPTGAAVPGVVRGDAGARETVAAFVAAMAKHRHFERETDPPLV
jgi:catalase